MTAMKGTFRFINLQRRLPTDKLKEVSDRLGQYFMSDFALSRGFDITDRLSLKLVTKTTLYTAEYVEYLSDGALNKAAFGGWDNGISLNYALTDNLSLGAHLNYLYKLDHRVRHCPGWDNYSVDNPKGSHDGLLYGGVSANLAF